VDFKLRFYDGTVKQVNVLHVWSAEQDAETIRLIVDLNKGGRSSSRAGDNTSLLRKSRNRGAAVVVDTQQSHDEVAAGGSSGSSSAYSPASGGAPRRGASISPSAGALHKRFETSEEAPPSLVDSRGLAPVLDQPVAWNADGSFDVSNWDASPAGALYPPDTEAQQRRLGLVADFLCKKKVPVWVWVRTLKMCCYTTLIFALMSSVCVIGEFLYRQAR
jgi:hypothetical protein